AAGPLGRFATAGPTAPWGPTRPANSSPKRSCAPGVTAAARPAMPASLLLIGVNPRPQLAGGVPRSDSPQRDTEATEGPRKRGVRPAPGAPPTQPTQKHTPPPP